MSTLGTLASFLLQDVIKAGFKPVIIGLLEGEEAFVFRTEEEALEAEEYFSPEGSWLSQEHFDPTENMEGVTELDESAFMSEEDKEKYLAEIKIKIEAEIKAEKLKTLDKVIAKALKSAPTPPKIELAKSCETCNNCSAMLKDSIRTCTKNGEYVTGSAVCDDWELRKKFTKGGTRRFNDGKKRRGEVNKFIECISTVKHIGEIVFIERSSQIRLTSPNGVTIQLESMYSDEYIARLKTDGRDMSRYERYLKWNAPRVLNKNQVSMYSKYILNPKTWK